MKQKCKKMMVILLSLMMTISSFISFSFAEDTQDQTTETKETVAEAKAEPAEVKAPAPEPEPEPVVVNSGSGGGAEVYEEVVEEDVSYQEEESGSDYEQVLNQNEQGSNPEDQIEEIKEEEKEDEEEKMPAQSFSGSAGGLSVNAFAPEGAFPEGTSMVVSPANIAGIISMSNAATGEDFTVVDAVAADISFYKNGKEIQPAGGKAVNIKLSANYAVGGQEHSVIHVSGGGVDIVGGASAGGASVKAGSFSVYGIIGGNYDDVEKFARHTYVFHVDGKEIGSRIVRDGDTLNAPAVNLDDPSRKFVGWYDGGNKVSFPMNIKISDTESDGKEIVLNAKFDKQSNVTFKSQSEHVLAVRSGTVGEEVSTEGIDLEVSASQVISGWAKKGSTTPLKKIVFEEEDYDLYPIIDEVRWLTFDTNAGEDSVTYIAPKYAKIGEPVGAPTFIPIRAGWKFDGWFDQAEGGSKVTFPMTLTSDTTVYAHWTAENTSYTVRVWKEALAGGTYSPGNYALAMTTKVENVKSGSIVNGSDNNNYNFSDKKHYDFEKADQNVVVKGDGTTVVNVYYKLKEYTVVFNLNGRLNNRTVYGKLTKGGVTYKESYDFKAHYGENIYNVWPRQNEMTACDKDGNELKDTKFVRWNEIWASDRYTFADDIIQYAKVSGNTLTYNPEYRDNPNYYEAHYYLQNADNKSKYEEDETLKQEKFYYVNSFGHKELAGFTYLRNTPKGYTDSEPSKRIYRFYYDRNELTLTFVNGGITDKTHKVVFEQHLNDFNYTPEKPASILGEAEFGGWYTSEDCIEGTEFDLTTGTMTTNNLTLYAKWTMDQYEVSFDMNGADSAQIESQFVTYGGTAKRPTDPKRKDYRFGGWLNGDAPYTFNEHVTENTKLTAKWLKDETEYQLIYMVEGKTVSSPSEVYCDGSSAVAMGRPVGVKADKAFIGWSYDAAATEVHVAPGKTFVIDHNRANAEHNIILHAVLKDEKGTVNVIYKDGNGNSYTDKSIVINGNYALLTPEACEFKAPEGQEFAGWQNTNKETFAAGAIVAAGAAEEENILTAQWKDKEKPDTVKVGVIVTGVSGTAEYTGEEQFIEGYNYEVVAAEADAPIILRSFNAAAKASETIPKDAVTVTLKPGKEARAAGTNPGTYPMNLTMDHFDIKTAEGYELVGVPTINDGSLTINKGPNKDNKEDEILGDFEDDTNGGSGDEGGTRTEVKSAANAGVKTGDSNSLFLYIMVFCLGVITLIMMGIIRSKPSKKK